MRRNTWIGLGLALAVGLAACADESPTEVGSTLLGEGLRTVEVVLDAPAFLQGDTTYDSIGRLRDAGFGILADDFAGELDANILFQIDRPLQVTYTDANDATQIDSIINIGGGTLTVVLDTLSEVVGPLDFQVLELTEEWDPNSAGWTLRIDSGGVSESWTVPGGTVGSTLATTTWESQEADGDTVEIALDSATAAVWHDTTAARRGGALRVTSAGKRVRIQSLSFTFDVVPIDTPDTVLTAGSIIRQITVASPGSAPAAGSLRVGGLPAWRSLIQFLPLADVEVPCESVPTSCRVPLSDVTVNTANLVLQTRPVAGRRVERPMRVEGRAVLEGPGVPLTRSPLSLAFGRMGDSLAASAFTGTPVTTRVPVTGYVQRNVSPPDGEDPLLWLALTAELEKTLFGYAEFAGAGTPTPPRLQLVVTIPSREVTP